MRRWPSWADVAARIFGFWARLSARRWWWDDLYNHTVVRGAVSLARLAWQFDRWIIDGIIHGLAWLSRETADGLRRMQLGRLQGYGVAMFAGVNILLLIYLLWRT